jgi:hypothetical protein
LKAASATLVIIAPLSKAIQRWFILASLFMSYYLDNVRLVWLQN